MSARYASPVLHFYGGDGRASGYVVTAEPGGQEVGVVQQYDAGWTGLTLPDLHHAGLWPTKQAAAEVLVKQAGYELERS